MKFGYTIIYVNDVESTVHFYQIAFGLELHFMDEGKQYAQLHTGDTKLAFASYSLVKSNRIEFVKNNPENMAAGFEIAFTTENVNQAYEQALRSGAFPLAAPSLKPWGQTVGYVRDLNGILVEIATPME